MTKQINFEKLRLEVITELANKYKIIINEDDPIFAFVGFHKDLLEFYIFEWENFYTNQQEQLDKLFKENVNNFTEISIKHQNTLKEVSKNILIEYGNSLTEAFEKQKELINTQHLLLLKNIKKKLLTLYFCIGCLTIVSLSNTILFFLK